MTTYQQASGASAYSRPSYAPSFTRDYTSTSRDDSQQPYKEAWDTVIDELLRYRLLQDDWDGEGSAAPEHSLIDGAIVFAQNFQESGMAVPDRVFVGVNATVYFEWFTPIGYRAIEVVAPKEAENRFVRAGSETTEVVKYFR